MLGRCWGGAGGAPGHLLVLVTDLDADGALGHGGQARVPVEHGRDVLLQVHPVEPALHGALHGASHGALHGALHRELHSALHRASARHGRCFRARCAAQSRPWQPQEPGVDCIARFWPAFGPLLAGFGGLWRALAGFGGLRRCQEGLFDALGVPGLGQHSGVDDALVELLEASLHIAAEVDALEGGVDGVELRLPPQRGRADDAAVGQVLRPATVGGATVSGAFGQILRSAMASRAAASK